MAQFSKRQIAEFSNATAELFRVHPELDPKNKPRAKRVAKKGSKKTKKKTKVARKGIAERRVENLRAIVDESLPDQSEAEVTRFVEELVALSEGRPAILIRDDDYDLANHETLPDVLRQLLNDNRAALRQAIRGVGRIEVSNHPHRSWLGTGFVIAAGNGRDIVVTNRHVAVEMAFRNPDGSYRFVEGLIGNSRVSASLDLKEEVMSERDDRSAAVPIVEVVHIEDPGGPDLAFLRLQSTADSPQYQRLRLSPDVESRIPVAAIGYPAKDTRQTDLDIVLELLGDVYNKKRLAPGIIKSVTGGTLSHDCSTLGGNSGSPIIDLRSGSVVGLHYGGTFPNPINHAVSAERIADILESTSRIRPRTESLMPGSTANTSMATTVNADGQSVTIEIPLRISVSLGQPSAEPPAVTHGRGTPGIEAAVLQIQDTFGAAPGVLNVRAGLELHNGQFTGRPAVVVSIDHSATGSEASLARLPRSISGFTVQARAALPEELARAYAGVSLEAVPSINYEPPQDLSLDEVEDEMFAVFHVSPDAGWPELEEFLSRTRESLTIGLYNFATDHIKDALGAAVSPGNRTFDLVLGDAGLDRDHTDEFEAALVEEFSNTMGDRFRFELADGARRLFAGHYHVKVAVRDSRAVWLSSGNWESSNQPDVDPVAAGETSFSLLRERNREWHAVVLNDRLAETFEQYIHHDLESYRALRTAVPEAPPAASLPLFLVPKATTVEEDPPGEARYFAPLFVFKRLRIQPLMTPDNYIGHVTDLVASATETIELQNQSLKWRDTNVDPRFELLMNTLLDKHNNGVQVRFVMRNDFPNNMKELLVGHGFDADQIRMQSRCHTKGMIVDSERVLLGSHNLTEHGALVNRDASLIVHDREVAEYFRQIFEFDWSRASQSVRETPQGISLYRLGDPIPDGYEVVSIPDMSL